MDCVALRLPHHAQPDRVVEDDPFLNTKSGLTDLLICEVKSEPAMLAFNGSMKNDPDALAGILRWAGTHDVDSVPSVADKMRALFDEDLPLEQARAGFTEGNVRIRALLCCPPMDEVPNDRWRLTGGAILSYAEQCFMPEEARPSCSVRCNFQQWGQPFRQIVTWLKDTKRTGPAKLTDLYKHLRDEG